MLFGVRGIFAVLALSRAIAAPPHIVYVLLDDFGWAEAGFQNASQEVRTPSLDALAAEGLRLNRHYTHKICSPSRSAIQTGRAPIHVNVAVARAVCGRALLRPQRGARRLPLQPHGGPGRDYEPCDAPSR